MKTLANILFTMLSMTANTEEQIRQATTKTLADYGAVAEQYARGNMDHDVSQNIHAMLEPLQTSKEGPFDILDVCCASGRDLVAFKAMGHRPVGLDGVPEFCRMARKLSGCDVWEQNLATLNLPPLRFDAVFCNACLFHLPLAALSSALTALQATLRDGGILFVSNAHGFGKDQEGWTNGRTPTTRSYVCWLSEDTWIQTCEAAGFELLDKFYRPPGKPREQQPFLATVWRKKEA
mmetsp:Transcript_22650/g.34353  ORF Transcript_22650/g.34353 Transcript_22650/m.34353 type:complete len:235 (-) Transcript_22650:159-863(-)